MSSRALGYLIFAVQALWLITAPAALAQDKPPATSAAVSRELIAAVPRDWPPQYSLDKKGNPSGFAIEVMNEIGARAGFRITYKIFDTFADVDKAMDDGKADIVPNNGIIPDRIARYAFTAPVETFVISIFVRHDSKDIKSLKDLPNHRVAIVKSNAAMDLIRARTDIDSVIYPEPMSALFELLSGHVDALVYPRPVLLSLARQAGVEDRIMAVGSPVMEVKRAIRVQKNKPEILVALDKAVNEFVGTPDYQRIYVKWYGKPVPFRTAPWVGWAVGGLFAALLLIFVVWRYRLIVQTNRRIAASEEKFRHLIEGAVPGVLIHRDQKPLFVNGSYARIFGYDSPDELLRQASVLDHVAPQERARLKEYAAARLRGDEVPLEYEFQGERKDGTLIWLENRGRIVDWEGAPAVQRMVVDITKKRRAEAELMVRSSQQAVVAELGQQALMNQDLATLMNTAVALVAKMLSADFSKILELLPGGDELLLRAGVGWKPGLVGRATVSAGKDSQAGFTLLHRQPVVVKDLRQETRFKEPPLLRDHGIVSGVSVTIGDPEHLYGVLAVHTKTPRVFSDDDALFLKTVAVMLASAISRKQAGDALRAGEERLRGALESLQEGFVLYDADDRMVMMNEEYHRFTPDAEEFLKKSAHFEDIVRTHVKSGLILDAVGREEEFIRERIEQHRALKGPIIRHHSNGKWYVIKETRTPEGGVAMTYNDITELKRAEDALKESEERLRGALESLQEGFALFDADDRLVMINDVYRRINPNAQELLEKGANFEDLIRANVESGLIADAAGREEKFIQKRIAQHRNPKGSMIRRMSEGRWYIIKETRTPEGGTAITFTDITELKRADQALSETQQRLQIVVDNLPMGVNVKDADGRYVLVNKRFEKWYDLSAADIIGKMPDEVSELLKAAMPRRKAHEESVIHTKSVIARQDKFLQADGKVHDMEVTKFPVLDADGKVTLIGTVSTDITERNRAEQALRKSEALFRAVVNHSPAKIHIKDVEGRYILINKEAEKLFGVTDEEGKGKTSYDLFPKEEADAFVVHDREVIEFGRTMEKEEEFVRKDGVYTYLTVKFPIFDGNQVTGVGAIGTDISKRKHEERKLAELQAELAHVSRISTMGEMTAGLAHELNQPLAAITNYAKGTLRRLHAGGGNTIDLLPIMELVAEQALRAGEIIRKIRGFMNRSAPHKSRIDLHRTIDEVMLLLAGEINISGIEVTVTVPSSLPTVMADSIQIQQVLLNLIRNAVVAMDDDGTNHHRLEIGAKANGRQEVEIYVRDNGPGIPADVNERLFEPFFTTKTDGLGMGLSISRSIVTNHNGQIWVSSNTGKGATFHFTLPTGTDGQHDAP